MAYARQQNCTAAVTPTVGSALYSALLSGASLVYAPTLSSNSTKLNIGVSGTKFNLGMGVGASVNRDIKSSGGALLDDTSPAAYG